MSKKPQLSLLAVGVSVATLLLASTSSFAAAAYKGENYKGEAMPPCPVETMLKDGFYVGAQVGYDMYRIKNDADFIDFFGNEFSIDPTVSANGWAGGLFVGYGKYWDTFYLGGEIFANGSGAKADWDGTFTDIFGNTFDIDTDVKIKSEYGVSLLPGYKVNNNSLVYVRVGYNWARIDADVDATSTFFPFTFTDSGDNNKTLHGWSGGLGIETLIVDNFSVRTEYTYTKYNHSDNGFDHVTDNKFMLALLYHFA